MKVGHVELLVRDPLASRRFYEEVLGFRVEAVQAETFVWLDAGGTEILLRPGGGAADASSYDRAASALVLYTDDLPAERRRLESRGLEFRGTDGSDDCMTFTDPDGNWFQLVDPSGR